jgi:hypothetical protein
VSICQETGEVYTEERVDRIINMLVDAILKGERQEREQIFAGRLLAASVFVEAVGNRIWR